METADVILALGSSVISGSIGVFFAPLFLEKRIALKRAVAEGIARERLASIMKLGDLLSRAEREADEVEREKRRARERELFVPTVDDLMLRLGIATPQVQAAPALVGVDAAMDAESSGASTALAELAATAEAASRRYATLEALAELTRTPPKPAAPRQRRQWPYVSPRDPEPGLLDVYSLDELESFIYSGPPTPPQEQLMNAFREALNAALNFLSPDDLGELEALVPKAVRGSRDAVSKARRILAAATNNAQVDHNGFVSRLERRIRRS